MALTGTLVALERITPELARRIIAREERSGDNWHSVYPLVDELDPLRSLAVSIDSGSEFTRYLVRQLSSGLAVGGFGFFGPPDEDGRVKFGYGLVPSARGRGLATEAVRIGREHAARHGARLAAADTNVSNFASRRVLAKAGLLEVARNESVVFFERSLVAR